MINNYNRFCGWIIFTFFIGLNITTAQQNQDHNFKCGGQLPPAHLMNQKMYEQYRNIEIGLMQNSLKNRANLGDTVLVVPIVFHIVHEYGPENISDAQVFDAVRILNEDYQMLNADTADVIAPFDTVIGNPRIEFRLAKIDPNGDCTNGIDRIFSLETRVGDDGSKFNAWPREKYLNVWVVKTMQNGVAGYAYYPSATESVAGPFIDGVIILQQYIGSIGTGDLGRSRALTHEIGHYLGLSHTWGSTNDPTVACGDDDIEDTPITKGWKVCNLTANDICYPGTPENVQNYMEYAYCSNMFTKGQALSMRFIIGNQIALRNNLWSAANRVATGVNLPSTLCSPKADFIPQKIYVCSGEAVMMNDHSYNGAASAWQWSFPNGTPSSSTLQNPTVVFNTSGWQPVSLTVTNAAGTNTYQLQKAVYVSNSYSEHAGLYIENFEGKSNQMANFLYPSRSIGTEHLTNPIEIIFGNILQNASWDLATNAGASGTKSMRLNALHTNNLMVDELLTPSYDLTLLSSGFFTFKFSSATTTSVVADINAKLKIYSSTDCGKTWQFRSQINDLNLVNAGLYDSYYVPNSTSPWNKVDIAIPASLKINNVRFKFEYTSGLASNSIYLDDIGIEGVLNVAENEVISSVLIYPNPSGSLTESTLNFSSAITTEVTVAIYNSIGQKVTSKEGVSISVGNNSMKLGNVLPVSQLPKGYYVLSLSSIENGAINQSFVIE